MELMEHEQIIANESIWRKNYEGFGEVRHARPAARFEETPSEIVRPAPKLGEHVEYILKEFLSFSPEQVSEFYNDKII